IEQGIINDHAGPSAERAKRVESGRGTDISDTHDIGKEVVTHTRIGPAPVTLDAKEGAATLKIVPSLGTAGKGIIRSNESSRLIGKIEGKYSVPVLKFWIVLYRADTATHVEARERGAPRCHHGNIPYVAVGNCRACKGHHRR